MPAPGPRSGAVIHGVEEPDDSAIAVTTPPITTTPTAVHSHHFL